MTDSSAVKLHERDEALVEEQHRARDIVTRIRNGDSSAETELVERYQKGMHFLVTRKIGDDERARDVVQEVFYIALQKIRSTDLEQPERLAGYLRGVAVRTILNANRKRQREPVPLDMEALDAISNVKATQFRDVAAAQSRSAIHQTLRELSVDRDRELLMRYYVHDEDKDRICDELGIDRSYFNRVLFRAKARFRKCLEEAGYGSLAGGGDDD